MYPMMLADPARRCASDVADLDDTSLPPPSVCGEYRAAGPGAVPGPAAEPERGQRAGAGLPAEAVLTAEENPDTAARTPAPQRCDYLR